METTIAVEDNRAEDASPDIDAITAREQIVSKLLGYDREVWDEEPVADQPQRVRFTVDSESRADWLAGKYLGLLEKAENAKRRSEEYKRDAAQLLQHFGPDILTWVQQEAGGKAKSVKVDAGRVGYSDVTDRIDIPDSRKEQKAQLVNFVREKLGGKAEELIREQTVEDVPIGPFKALLELRTETIVTDQETGETLDIHRVVVAGTDIDVPFAVVKSAQEPYIRPLK